MHAQLLKAALAASLGLGLALGAAPGRAAPVALATEVSGETVPPIEPFTEIEPGTSLELGETTQIEFMRYTSCETVTVVGGRITFTEQQFLVQRGKIVDVKRSRCPEVAQPKADSNLGGVLLRGGNADLKLMAAPRLAFVGAGRAAYDRLRVLKGKTVILEAPIAGHQFTWPADAAALTPADDYTLELLRGDGGKPTRLVFEVTAKRGTAPLTVVRLD